MKAAVTAVEEERERMLGEISRVQVTYDARRSAHDEKSDSSGVDGVWWSA